MPERSGSYPLMNLAADFGVDYGDVLLVADAAAVWLLTDRADECPGGRKAQYQAAAGRIEDSIGLERAERLGERLEPIVVARADRLDP